MRLATGRSPNWATECSQPAWQAPPITSRSPEAGARSWVAPLAGEWWSWRLARARSSQGRMAPRGEHGDDGVVEPAHVPVAVEGLAVVAVAVTGEGEGVEAHPVAGLQRPVDLQEHRVGYRVAPLPEGAEPGLAHPAVVAEQPAPAPPCRRRHVVVEHVGAGCEAPHDVDPRPLVEHHALGGGVADEGGRHGPDATDAGGRRGRRPPRRGCDDAHRSRRPRLADYDDAIALYVDAVGFTLVEDIAMGPSAGGAASAKGPNSWFGRPGGEREGPALRAERSLESGRRRGYQHPGPKLDGGGEGLHAEDVQLVVTP